MEKEIQMSGQNHVFIATTPLGLIDELADFLDGIQSGSRVSNLLYRIDVNLKKADPKLPYYKALSVLAWNRVYKKVWLRNRIKTGNR